MNRAELTRWGRTAAVSLLAVSTLVMAGVSQAAGDGGSPSAGTRPTVEPASATGQTGGAITAEALGEALAAGAAAGEPETVTVLDASGEPVSLDLGGLLAFATAGSGGSSSGSRDLPPFSAVSRGFEKVVSTADGGAFYNVWVNREENQLLAELPRGFESQRHFFAMTVAGGEIFAGLQAGDMYLYWKRYGRDRVALVMPQLAVRSTGEATSRRSVDRLFTDRVLVDVPVVARGPSGQPVIDLDNLLVGRASTFFGYQAAGLNGRLAEVKKAKAFPENIEIAIEAPAAGGVLKTYHYSISLIKGTPGFRPRAADTRVGYFTTSYRDLGKYDTNEVMTRYINRWHVQKADPNLKLSPPKEPIIFYVEHTTPVRYRRWVRRGVEYWNRAFEAVGIDGAIEVRFQDATTGAHMDKDPEDVRFNFIRWLNNDIATAIGPSRVNPTTGEILDADIILTDGWLRVFTYRFDELLPELAMEGFGPETLSWLAENPEWDPRVRMAGAAERDGVRRRISAASRGVQRFGGHAAAAADPTLLGDDEYDGLAGRVSQVSGGCQAAFGKALSFASARLYLDSLGALGPVVLLAMTLNEGEELPEMDPEELERLREQMSKHPELLEFIPEPFRARIRALLGGDAEDEAEEPAAEEPAEEPEAEAPGDDDAAPSRFGDGDMLDGMPEQFIGPMLAELVAHEVGHTIGLRHNFKASSAYEYSEINSESFRGERPWSASVMDYNGINIRMPREGTEEDGTAQGDFSVIDIGPYDMFAIEYGYTFDEPEKVLEKSTDPQLAYATDEDTWGPDPLARRYDLAADPLTWSKSQIELAEYIRGTLLDDFVEDGESWARARRGYLITLSQHIQAVSTMANWIGGAYVNRIVKGDGTERSPIEPVSAADQRDALVFAIEHTFRDEAFGLTPELLRYLTLDKWYDTPSTIFQDPTFDIHGRVLGVQSSVLTMLMNPTTLTRVLNNEKYVPRGDDALTLAELVRTLSDAVWTELEQSPNGRFTERTPMISSLRRNLQREHVERLIDLALGQGGSGPAAKPIATLAAMHLREIKSSAARVVNRHGSRLDDYSRAHLEEVETRIAKALDAQYIYNTDDIGGGGGGLIIMLGQDGKPVQINR